MFNASFLCAQTIRRVYKSFHLKNIKLRLDYFLLFLLFLFIFVEFGPLLSMWGPFYNPLITANWNQVQMNQNRFMSKSLFDYDKLWL